MWCCIFDFEHVPNRGLQVLTQRVAGIYDALRAGLDSMDFDGTVLPVVASTHMLITMTPPRGALTVALPDGIQAVFRPLALVQPVLHPLAELELLRAGFSKPTL